MQFSVVCFGILHYLYNTFTNKEQFSIPIFCCCLVVCNYAAITKEQNSFHFKAVNFFLSSLYACTTNVIFISLLFTLNHFAVKCRFV